jgi:hypothetical protein
VLYFHLIRAEFYYALFVLAVIQPVKLKLILIIEPDGRLIRAFLFK